MMPMPRTRDAAQSTIPRSSSTQPQFYVPIPQRLVTLLHDTPLAIGLYALIARLYFAAHAPVALSRGDIQRYDPALKEGAVKRALDRLLAGGWIIEAAGHKCRYIPSWGPARDGTPRPWRIGADYLGCPRHVFTLRLDRDILDLYMGKLTPQAHNTALVDRYFTAPLLSLRDVGAYLLILAGQQLTGTPALLRWELVRDGQAQPIPDAAQVLALASQRQLDDPGAVQLTAAGWRKLGLSIDHHSPPDPVPTAQPLFFMPPELIGALIPPSIGALIGHADPVEAPTGAPEPVASDNVMPAAIIQRNHGESKESRDHPPTPPHSANSGDGGLARRSKRAGRRRPAPPQTESAHLLRAIGVLPEIIIELADTPIERVTQAIAHGQARPEVRDLAGWVVKLLRTARDYGWAIPEPRPADAGAHQRPQLIDVEHYTSGAYGDLFRRGSDTSDLEPLDHGIEELAQRAVGAPAPDAPFERIAPDASRPARSRAVERLDAPLRNECSDGDLTQPVREQLLLSCDRRHRRVIERLRVQVVGDMTLIRYASLADARVVQDQLLGALRQAIADLGGPPTIRLTGQAPQGQAIAAHRSPAWHLPHPPGPK